MIKLSKKNQRLLSELKMYSQESYFHSLRVKTYVQLYFRYLSRNGINMYSQQQLDYILTGSILHDVGKIYVKNYVLTKKGKLTDSEMDNIRIHTQRGAEEVCKDLAGEECEIVGNICKYHHERIDGRGNYGIKDIPYYVQVVSLCDVYDALVSDRIYKSGMPHEKAIELIKSGACGAFDSKLIEYIQVITQNKQVER